MQNNELIRNVLVAVDVQNDFINGSLAVNGGEEVVTPINNTASTVRSSGGTVVFTRDWHPTSTPHFDTWPTHCVADTEGAEFHSDLEINNEDLDIIVSKGIGQTDGYSGWEGVSDNGQTLETIITPQTQKEMVRVFIGGLATDYCVQATALDIAKHFEDDTRVSLYLLRDAIRAVNLKPEDEARALEAIAAARIAAISSEEARALIERTAL